MLSKRDKAILKRIVEYCDDIKEIIERFGDTPEALKADKVFRHSVSMCILQIGELTTHLTAEFVTANPQIPWKNIRGMRNIAAHHYGKFDMNTVHDTIIADVPAIRGYFQKLLDEK